MLVTTDQKANPASLRVQESAKKLERHIRACGLKAGDRYITTQEAGRLLGTSLVLAQRAMTLLAQRNILDRRPKAGTFISDGISSGLQTRNIHFFSPEQSRLENEMQTNCWEMIDGMKGVLGPLSAHLHFIPNQNLDYVRQLVDKMSAANLLNGAVLILPSREIRAFFNQSGIPTVVGGGVEADLSNLCWIQWDQVQVGRSLSAYLLEKGHRRLVTVMRDIWSIGEHLLHDGINETLTSANLPSNTLRVRSAPNEEGALIELTRELLADTNPPTGFICRNEFQADCVSKASIELGFRDRVDITHCNAPSNPDSVRYVCALPELSTCEFGKIAGRLFHQLMNNQTPAPRGQQIPIRLKIPAAP